MAGIAGAIGGARGMASADTIPGRQMERGLNAITGFREGYRPGHWTRKFASRLGPNLEPGETEQGSQARDILQSTASGHGAQAAMANMQFNRFDALAAKEWMSTQKGSGSTVTVRIVSPTGDEKIVTMKPGDSASVETSLGGIYASE